MRQQICRLLLVGASCLLLCSGCVKRTRGGGGTAGLVKNEQTTTADVQASNTDASKYSSDMVIVLEVDETNKQLSVKSIRGKGIYVLKYSGGTRIRNRFGTEMLMKDLAPGEIAEVSYTPGTQKTAEIKESENAWENNTVVKWSMDTDKHIITIGGEKYTYDDEIAVFSDGKQVDIQTLNTVDTLIAKGVDKKIYSLSVKTGHGYIRVIDAMDLKDGLIEVGTTLMTVITDDMLLVAPEGTYTLTASKDGVGGSTEVTVKKNDEVTVSLAPFQGEVQREGTVKFNIKPAGVQYQVFIDGKVTDGSDKITLSYGRHKLVITSDQYVDYTENIVVASVYMNKTVDLSAREDTTFAETTTQETTAVSETTASNDSTSQETTTAQGVRTDKREDGVESVLTANANNKVIIRGPAGAEVYMDGISLGVAPMTIDKPSGTHIFVLRQEGYVTTAYSYTFDNTADDVYLKFPDMEESS